MPNVPWMRPLIVEDTPAVGDMLCDLVRELGHEPRLVATAEAALEALAADRPDAILLDIVLPGMTGLEFLQQPMVRASQLPIVAISGLATEAQARECLRHGALDFLTKPVPFDRLRTILALIEVETQDPRSPWRRSPRASIRLAVHAGSAWEWTAIDLSPFGIKVPPQTVVSPGTTVMLSFTLPDGGPAIEVQAVLVRADRDGHLFSFVNLDEAPFRRLTTFLRRADVSGQRASGNTR
ncbi:MAG: response regulator [Candidatus Rokubacteria bacterium]|nr:response regulator [Candidatus Rokubacteria bacterium]